MNCSRSTAGSAYMEWAKHHSSAKFNLATSGMAGLPLSELGVEIEDLEINSASNGSGDGYDPLLEALARRYHTPKQCVVSAMGTSFANYLALAAATDPGEEILVEQPTYEPLVSVARFLGLTIRRFQRRSEKNFAVDPAEVERNLTPRTRVIVICNLHNPSGALTPDTILREVQALARQRGAYVLVDEVYREMLFEAEPETAFHLDPERFLITNSLTKAYGLSGLRCGWVLAPAKLAARMWRLHDIHAGTYAHPAELLSVRALEILPQIAARMKRTLDANRALLRDFLNRRDDLDCFWPDHGTVVFPRLRNGNVDALCDLLRRQFETTVAPGRFFESPDRFRIGVGLATDTVAQSLAQLGLGMDRFQTAMPDVRPTGLRSPS
ncbi:MAG TPA: pyridoxal phosphate-dependent aminotransferase [Terriglobales bacterium]